MMSSDRRSAARSAFGRPEWRERDPDREGEAIFWLLMAPSTWALARPLASALSALSINCLRVVTEAVSACSSFLAIENKQCDNAKRDNDQQLPPAGAVRVV